MKLLPDIVQEGAGPCAYIQDSTKRRRPKEKIANDWKFVGAPEQLPVPTVIILRRNIIAARSRGLSVAGLIQRRSDFYGSHDIICRWLTAPLHRSNILPLQYKCPLPACSDFRTPERGDAKSSIIDRLLGERESNMADLRTYMSTEFFEDTRIIEELESEIGQVAKTFEKTYDTATKSWTYTLTSGENYPSGGDSESTTAMILCSLLAMRGDWQNLEGFRASS